VASQIDLEERAATARPDTPEMLDLLACPADGGTLTPEAEGLACARCGTVYAARGRYVDFLKADHEFYESKYCNEIRINPPPGLLRELPLWLLVHGYVWAVRKFVKPGSVVVELGCAGGIRWFGARYRMIGLDFSRAGLEIAAQDYRLALRGDALRLPLADASVDAVVSACFFEHIAPNDKPKLLAEVRRVLKPGGRVIFQYDVETANPLIAAYRERAPDLYRREFLDNDGHIGYQPLAENDRIFRAAGLSLLRSVALERLPLQADSVWGKLGKWPGRRGRVAARMSRLLGGRMTRPNIAFLRIVDETVGRLAPSRWGRIALTVAQKD
jgi:SAM-dependent methyltransferase